MKKLLLCAALLAPAAYAADPEMCYQLGFIYKMAAYERDIGKPPEIALLVVEKATAVPLEMRKAAINQVYFDERFANSRDTPLSFQVQEACMRDFKPLHDFKPLE